MKEEEDLKRSWMGWEERVVGVKGLVGEYWEGGRWVGGEISE